MCRRNQMISGVLIALGVGILLGGWIDSCLLRFLLAGISIFFGISLSGRFCRHK